MDIFIILMCILFIILVIFQVPATNGINNLTSSEESSIVVKKISLMTKFMFSLGLFIFLLVFLFSYFNKKEEFSSLQIEDKTIIEVNKDNK